MSDDRPTGEPEQPTPPVPPIPEQPVAPEALPTTPLPPMGGQPTEFIDPAPAAPAPPVPPSGHEVWPPAQAEPEWHASQFATGGVETAPARKGLAVTALILGIAAVVFAVLGFVPLVGFAFLGLGGLLGVVALILGIITLAGKNRQGRGMGLTGIILGAVGVLLAIVAIVFQLSVLVSVGNAVSRSALSSSTPVPLPQASDAATPGVAGAAAGDYDEKAYLAAVKPQLLALMQSINPSATKLPWTDDYLVTMGQSVESLGTDKVARTAAREAVVKMVTEASKGAVSTAKAAELFDIIAQAADAHLQQQQ